MTKNKILIFSATYNEIGNIENFIKSIVELNLPLDILLIDDTIVGILKLCVTFRQ